VDLVPELDLRGSGGSYTRLRMALLGDEVAAELKQELQGLDHPVRLKVFSQALPHPESDQVRQLVEELAGLDSRIRAESYDFVRDQDEVEALGIARVPAIAVMGESKDYGLRLYGLPQGYEFGALVDAILDVSRGESGLSEETKAALRALDKPVHIQVFSTPTCPYCPRALRLAYQFAIESDKVTADGVEVTGYPDLVREYRVSSVPKTVVGDREFSVGAPSGRRLEFIGAGSEAMLLKHVQEAAGVNGP
jgi:glutaredoxin-like protein